MSNDILRWLLALAVLGHGIGHVLFMPMLNTAMRLDASGESWFLSGPLGSEAVRAVASVAAAVALVGFVAGAGSIALQSASARPLVVGATVVSLVLVAAMWGGLPMSSAVLALGFDVLVLVAIFLLHWPTAEIVR